MNLDRTYILDEPINEMRDIRMSKQGNMILFCHEGGTKTFSLEVAKAIQFGFAALLSGQFDRAVTETHLRLEAEREARRAANLEKNRATQLSLPPTLESL